MSLDEFHSKVDSTQDNIESLDALGFASLSEDIDDFQDDLRGFELNDDNTTENITEEFVEGFEDYAENEDYSEEANDNLGGEMDEVLQESLIHRADQLVELATLESFNELYELSAQFDFQRLAVGLQSPALDHLDISLEELGQTVLNLELDRISDQPASEALLDLLQFGSNDERTSSLNRMINSLEGEGLRSTLRVVIENTEARRFQEIVGENYLTNIDQYPMTWGEQIENLVVEYNNYYEQGQNGPGQECLEARLDEIADLIVAREDAETQLAQQQAEQAENLYEDMFSLELDIILDTFIEGSISDLEEFMALMQIAIDTELANIPEGRRTPGGELAFNRLRDMVLMRAMDHFSNNSEDTSGSDLELLQGMLSELPEAQQYLYLRNLGDENGPFFNMPPYSISNGLNLEGLDLDSMTSENFRNLSPENLLLLNAQMDAQMGLISLNSVLAEYRNEIPTDIPLLFQMSADIQMNQNPQQNIVELERIMANDGAAFEQILRDMSPEARQALIEVTGQENLARYFMVDLALEFRKTLYAREMGRLEIILERSITADTEGVSRTELNYADRPRRLIEIFTGDMRDIIDRGGSWEEALVAGRAHDFSSADLWNTQSWDRDHESFDFLTGDFLDQYTVLMRESDETTRRQTLLGFLEETNPSRLLRDNLPGSEVLNGATVDIGTTLDEAAEVAWDELGNIIGANHQVEDEVVQAIEDRDLVYLASHTNPLVIGLEGARLIYRLLNWAPEAIGDIDLEVWSGDRIYSGLAQALIMNEYSGDVDEVIDQNESLSEMVDEQVDRMNTPIRLALIRHRLVESILDARRANGAVDPRVTPEELDEAVGDYIEREAQQITRDAALLQIQSGESLVGIDGLENIAEQAIRFRDLDQIIAQRRQQIDMAIISALAMAVAMPAATYMGTMTTSYVGGLLGVTTETAAFASTSVVASTAGLVVEGATFHTMNSLMMGAMSGEWDGMNSVRGWAGGTVMAIATMGILKINGPLTQGLSRTTMGALEGEAALLFADRQALGLSNAGFVFGEGARAEAMAMARSALIQTAGLTSEVGLLTAIAQTEALVTGEEAAPLGEAIIQNILFSFMARGLALGTTNLRAHAEHVGGERGRARVESRARVLREREMVETVQVETSGNLDQSIRVEMEGEINLSEVSSSNLRSSVEIGGEGVEVGSSFAGELPPASNGVFMSSGGKVYTTRELLTGSYRSGTSALETGTTLTLGEGGMLVSSATLGRENGGRLPGESVDGRRLRVVADAMDRIYETEFFLRDGDGLLGAFTPAQDASGRIIHRSVLEHGTDISPISSEGSLSGRFLHEASHMNDILSVIRGDINLMQNVEFRSIIGGLSSAEPRAIYAAHIASSEARSWSLDALITASQERRGVSVGDNLSNNIRSEVMIQLDIQARLAISEIDTLLSSPSSEGDVLSIRTQSLSYHGEDVMVRSAVLTVGSDYCEVPLVSRFDRAQAEILSSDISHTSSEYIQANRNLAESLRRTLELQEAVFVDHALISVNVRSLNGLEHTNQNLDLMYTRIRDSVRYDRRIERSYRMEVELRDLVFRLENLPPGQVVEGNEFGRDLLRLFGGDSSFTLNRESLEMVRSLQADAITNTQTIIETRRVALDRMEGVNHEVYNRAVEGRMEGIEAARSSREGSDVDLDVIFDFSQPVELSSLVAHYDRSMELNRFATGNYVLYDPARPPFSREFILQHPDRGPIEAAIVHEGDGVVIVAVDREMEEYEALAVFNPRRS